MKIFLRSLSIALAIGTTHAAVIFEIGDVVRPGGSGTANTIIFGTSNANPSSMTVVSGSSVAFSGDNGLFVTYFNLQTLSVGDKMRIAKTGDFALGCSLLIRALSTLAIRRGQVILPGTTDTPRRSGLQ